MTEKIDPEIKKIISDYFSYDRIDVHEFARRVNNRYKELKMEGLVAEPSGMWYK